MTDLNRFVPIVAVVPERVVHRIDRLVDERRRKIDDPEAEAVMHGLLAEYGWTAEMLAAGSIITSALDEAPDE